MIENKLVFTTDVAKWYVNSFTVSLTKYLHSDDKAELLNRELIVFPNYVAYMVELIANKNKEYVIVDNKVGAVVYSSQSFEAVCYWIDAIRLNNVMK